MLAAGERRNRMRLTTAGTPFRTAGPILLLVLLLGVDRAGAGAGKWSVTLRSADLRKEIELSDGTTSRAMSVDARFLEIRAVFSSSDETSLTLGRNEIAVTGALVDGMFLGVGIPGPKGTCVYTSTLGFSGTASGEANTGDGYRLERKQGTAGTLTLLKNRSSLCLAFGVDGDFLDSLRRSGEGLPDRRRYHRTRPETEREVSAGSVQPLRRRRPTKPDRFC